MKENLPTSYQFEGIGSPWRAFHSSQRQAIASSLMTCGNCLASRVTAFNVNFACPDCRFSAQDPLNFENPKEAFSTSAVQLQCKSLTFFMFFGSFKAI